MSEDEAVVKIYCSTSRFNEKGEVIQTLIFWLPTRYDIRNEMFLVTVGLSRSCDKGTRPWGILEGIGFFFNVILTFSFSLQLLFVPD